MAAKFFLSVIACMLLVSTISGQFTNAQKEAVLAAHNTDRCGVSPAAAAMAPVTWDYDLETVAQQFINTCPGTHNDARTTAYHTACLASNGTGAGPTATGTSHCSDYVGENLAWGYGDGVAAVGGWEGEKTSYDLTTNKCASGAECGHYTQVVAYNHDSYSKPTTRIGCAMSMIDCPPPWGYKEYVCNYAFGGNFNGLPPYVAGSGTNAACSADNTIVPLDCGVGCSYCSSVTACTICSKNYFLLAQTKCMACSVCNSGPARANCTSTTDTICAGFHLNLSKTVPALVLFCLMILWF